MTAAATADFAVRCRWILLFECWKFVIL